MVLALGVVLLSGCGFIYNQPLVRSDGTIAFFIGNEGTYSILPEGDCHLALVENGRIARLQNVASSGDSGVLDWSIDGSEILFIETEEDELGQPISSAIYSSGVQTDSRPIELFHTQDSVLWCSFTENGDIAYLSLDSDSDIGRLRLYSKMEKRHSVLKDNIISYKRLGWDGTLGIISQSVEGPLKMGKLSTYNPLTAEEYEIASFFLSEDMEGSLLILPAWFLWDVSSDRKRAVISVYENALVTPYLENADELPTLYLIDNQEDCAYKVADYGILPSFSPDGKLMSYLAPTSLEDDTPVLYLYDYEFQEARALENTIGANTSFWIDSSTLGFTRENEGDTFAIMEVSLTTGEVKMLIPGN